MADVLPVNQPTASKLETVTKKNK